MKNPSIFSSDYRQRLWSMVDMAVAGFKPQNPVIKRLLWLVCALFAPRFVHITSGYEDRVKAHGHQKVAAKWILDNNTQAVIRSGSEHVPTSGPLLLVCNHSGLGDAIGVFATLPRTDVYTMVFFQGLLLALPNFLEYCIVIDKDNPTSALKQTIRYLKEGKTVLMFPRGEIEADPGLDIDSALASPDEWSESILFLSRVVKDLTVLPVAVGGAISRRALNNPLVKLYNRQEDRYFLASTFQYMFPFFKEVIGSVVYGNPLSGESITMSNIQNEMRDSLQQVHAQQQQLVAEKKLAPVKLVQKSGETS